MKRLILASNSPRRRELLAQINAHFEVEPSLYEERPSGLSAKETALAFAEGKAKEVLSRRAGCIVLGADTVVCLDGKPLGKPPTEKAAAEMLRSLRGRDHEVFTGVCLAGEDFCLKGAERTLVHCYPLSDEEIAAYIASGSPMDKAGAYGIQDGVLVQSYEGSYTNVVGLPLELVRSLLKEGGL